VDSPSAVGAWAQSLIQHLVRHDLARPAMQRFWFLSQATAGCVT
jgi:hypothetical protein